MDFTTLLQQLIIYKGLLDDFGNCAREEDEVCWGGDLKTLRHSLMKGSINDARFKYCIKA